MAKTVNIKQDEKDVIPVEILAKEIQNISAAFRKIDNSILSRKALVLLIQDALPVNAKLGKGDINQILDIIPQLEGIYLKKKK